MRFMQICLRYASGAGLSALAACGTIGGSIPGAVEIPSDPLTVAGIIEEVNAQRAMHDLPPLSHDPLLDAIAAARVADMLTHQYVAHESPQGETAESVAGDQGYAFIRLGENIAAGTFAGDADIVTQWMHSPGHRGQILDPAVTAIGVAAKHGMLEGREQWVAVQIFSRPRSACPPLPDVAEIERLKESLATIDANQESLRRQIDEEDTPATRRRLIERYNESIAGRNDLAKRINEMIDAYERAWADVRTCMEGP